MMLDHQRNPRRIVGGIGAWIAQAVTPVVVLGATVFIWEAATPASMSIARPIAEFSGVLEAETMRVRAEEEARYTELIAMAEERGQRQAQLEYEPKLKLLVAYVDRMSRAYDNLWGAYGSVTQNAYAAETELARLQSRQIAGTQVIDQLFANGAAALCHVGRLGNADDVADQACGLKAGIQTGLATEYVTPLETGRSKLPQSILSDFGDLREMFDEDATRMRQGLDNLSNETP